MGGRRFGIHSQDPAVSPPPEYRPNGSRTPPQTITRFGGTVLTSPTLSILLALSSRGDISLLIEADISHAADISVDNLSTFL